MQPKLKASIKGAGGRFMQIKNKIDLRIYTAVIRYIDKEDRERSNGGQV